MMAVLFLLYVITMVLAWYGRERESIYLFVITLMLSALMFWHHIDDPLHINL